MILYHSSGGKILIPGDAQDSTWEFVLANYWNEFRDCSLLVTPHHGRHSGMGLSYLDTVNPKLVLMGCAGYKDLDCDAFRDYWTITNNQAGNVVAEADSGGINIYVENEMLAKACEVDVPIKKSEAKVSASCSLRRASSSAVLLGGLDKRLGDLLATTGFANKHDGQPFNGFNCWHAACLGSRIAGE